MPQDRQTANKFASAEIDRLLNEKGFFHLHVLGRGDHLVIYSQDEGEKTNRARITRLSTNNFCLGFADHRGRWETTPFTGSIAELVTMLTEQFSYVLTEF
jgi:hypothetical protein